MNKLLRRRILPVGLSLLADAATAATLDLTAFSIEDLMQVKVVSAAKVEQALQDTASAVFVITADDIRRSGATNVMEALRLAPGVEVARIDSSRWAITIRGFNGRFANKLLVLIDGRTVYNTQFSGVYWEIQDLFLPDIERIEVVRGPGGALWGANAVNGVINIITRNAKDTQDGLVALTAGNEERAIAGVRYGGKLGDSAQYRIYGQFTERDGQTAAASGGDAGDDWRMGRGGFRLDWAPSARDAVTVQGDVYDGNLDQNYTLPTLAAPYTEQRLSPVTASGGSVQARWERQYSATSGMGLQAYYQYAKRDDPLYIVDSDTFDLDFQHNFALTDRQEIVWGLGYRRDSDQFTDTLFSSVKPSQLTTQLFSAFAQNQADLIPEQLRLTVGLKVEHNDFTGWEWQPSIRMLWTPHSDHRLWAAVSRAVRTPSRGEQNSRVNLFILPPSPLTGNLPTLFSIFGTESLQSENLIAYEIGYRARWSERLSVDAAAFYNDYDQIIASAPGTPFPETRTFPPYLVVPLELQNAAAGYNHGFELAADWRPTQAWRLQLAYSYLHQDIQGSDGEPLFNSGNLNQFSLLSSWNVRDDLDFDVWWRYVHRDGVIRTFSPYGNVEIDPYSTLTLRLGWRPRKDVELSLVGANLLDGNHLEYVQEAYTFPVEIERSIYGQVKWNFR
ncbi:MAG: TonB-dependent receptor [Candidatus Contendobacter sp.]|nr:TonB-dependent receptor [Candidatus Contendobacter sp.]MDG4556371.1 TonB-dependent receptor [Candidatus Contendobacter sp.]